MNLCVRLGLLFSKKKLLLMIHYCSNLEVRGVLESPNLGIYDNEAIREKAKILGEQVTL